jgi:hypothetical protein
MLIGDGGITDNSMLIPLLRRGVKTVLVCFQGDTLLATNATWNVRHRLVPQAAEFDADIPAYFGLNIPQPGQDLHRDMVFNTTDFPDLIEQLQASQASGGGIKARQKLTLVPNQFWGIKGGGEPVDVLWLYLGRALSWEQQLPADIRKHVQPAGKPTDPGWLVKISTFGPFSRFPNYQTELQQDLSVSQTTLLGSLASWTIMNNRADIETLFADPSPA